MTSKPTTDKQTNKWTEILFETEYFPFKKAGPGQIRSQDLCPPRHILFLQAKLAGNAKKIDTEVRLRFANANEEKCKKEF